MSPSILTFESIIGNAVNFTRTVVLTMDFFHWMTTANSDSVYGCSVVHKKDTQNAIGESLLSRAVGGSGANAWPPHAGPGLNTILFQKNFSCLIVFFQLKDQCFNRRAVDFSTSPGSSPHR